MAKLFEIASWLDEFLETRKFRDSSYNGLQVAADDLAVRRIGIAVDAGLSVIQQAIKRKCQMLIVHHGLLWGSQLVVRGAYAEKLRLLLTSRCALYASHLPLDGHMGVGNAAELARALALKDIQPAFEYAGMPIGVRAVSREARSLESFVVQCSQFEGAIKPLILPFGKKKISTVGIATGSGSFALAEAADRGIDLLISGEPKQSAYHEAKELKLNAIFAGHYATETFGVRAVGQTLKKKYKVQVDFIHEPTGI